MAHPLKNIPPVNRTCSHCGESYSWGPKYQKRIVAGTIIDLCNNCGFIIDAAREKLEHEQLNPWLDGFLKKYFIPRYSQTNPGLASNEDADSSDDPPKRKRRKPDSSPDDPGPPDSGA